MDRLTLCIWMRGDALAGSVDPALRSHLERAHAFYRDPRFLTDPQARPTVLCLHGYASGHPSVDGLAFGARRLYRAGLDVLLYTLPFHGRRAPRGARKSGAPFFGPNLVRTNEAFAQTIFETRGLMRHLARLGGGPIGAFGMSLGAYATALLAAVEPRLAFAIAMIPGTSFADLVWSEPIHRHRRQEAEVHGVTLGHFLRDLGLGA